MLLPEFNTGLNSFENLYVWFEKDLSERADYALMDAMEKVGKRLQYRIKGRAGLTRFAQHDSKVTRTPSPPGAPPARVTGRLLDSVKFEKYGSTVSSAGRYKYFAQVKVDAPYARVQEYGMTIYARGGKKMRFVYGGQPYEASRVFIPARPFMYPAKQWMVESGKLREILQEAVRDLRKVRAPK